MRRSIALSAAVVIGSATVLGGCTLFPSKTSPTPSPEPTANVKSSFPAPIAPTTVSSSSAVPVASQSAVPTTKGGLVKGKTTTKTTTSVTKTNPLFDTSFDSWSIINFPGQDYEKELIIYNKSDKPVLYSARAADRFSDNVPVSVNGSFEATGKMLPLSQEIIKLKARSNDNNPGFTTTVTINFISESNQILATKTVKVTAYTAEGDRVTIDAGNSDSQSSDVSYRSLASYPIRINNNNQRDLNFTAKIVNPEAAGLMAFSAKSGTIRTGNWWDTDVHFTKADTKVDHVTIEFTFTSTDSSDPYRSTKTVTLNIN